MSRRSIFCLKKSSEKIQPWNFDSRLILQIHFYDKCLKGKQTRKRFKLLCFTTIRASWQPQVCILRSSLKYSIISASCFALLCFEWSYWIMWQHATGCGKFLGCLFVFFSRTARHFHIESPPHCRHNMKKFMSSAWIQSNVNMLILPNVHKNHI